MDWAGIIVAVVGCIASIVTAYIAIIPQVKKNSIPKEEIAQIVNQNTVSKADIQAAIEGSPAIKALKEGLVTEMRKSLISEYWMYANRGFDMTQQEVDSWNDDFEKYQKLGGNGVIAELNGSLQMAILQRQMSRNDQRSRKL